MLYEKRVADGNPFFCDFTNFYDLFTLHSIAFLQGLCYTIEKCNLGGYVVC